MIARFARRSQAFFGKLIRDGRRDGRGATTIGACPEVGQVVVRRVRSFGTKGFVWLLGNRVGSLAVPGNARLLSVRRVKLLAGTIFGGVSSGDGESLLAMNLVRAGGEELPVTRRARPPALPP
jgi:hypothetical protein